MFKKFKKKKFRSAVRVVFCSVLATTLTVGTLPALAKAGGGGSSASNTVAIQADAGSGLSTADEGGGDSDDSDSENSGDTGGDAGGSGDSGSGSGGDSGSGDSGGGSGDSGGSGSGSGGTDTGGTDTGGDSGSDTGGDSGGTETNYNVGIYLYWEEGDDTNPTENPISVDETSPQIIDARGSITFYAQVERASTGDIGWADDMGIGCVWSIVNTWDEDGNPSSIELASIDRGTGTLIATAQGNGTVRVRCTASDPYIGYSECDVRILGNSGQPYVKDIEILDENGNVCDQEDSIRFEEDEFGLEHKFYARVTQVDPATGETQVLNTYEGDTVAGLKWSTSGNAGIGYVNEDTGVYIPQAKGTVELTAYMEAAGQLGEQIRSSIYILNSGVDDKDRDYTPADYLTVVVKYAAEDKSTYASRQDYEVARTWYYTPEQLAELGTVTNHYTLIKGDDSWDRMDAYGVYFYQLLDDFSLEAEDIEGFYFTAEDAYNPGFVGYDYLFADRYYYPNFSIGPGSISGAQQVAPMIALATNQISKGDGEDVVDVSTLSEQTRFRLCLGAENATTNNAQKSIYNINTITIILEGAPPTHWDENGHGQGGKPSSSTGDNSGSGTGDGDGDGDNNGSGSGDGDGDGDDNGNGGSGSGDGDDNGSGGDDNGNSGAGDDDGNAGSGDMGAGDADNSGSGQDGSSDVGDGDSQAGDSSTGGSQTSNTNTQSQQGDSGDAQTSAEASQNEGTGDATGTENGTQQNSSSWQIYEMMRKDDPGYAALNVENPLMPWAYVSCVAVLIAGGLSTFIRYRRNLPAPMAVTA